MTLHQGEILLARPHNNPYRFDFIFKECLRLRKCRGSPGNRRRDWVSGELKVRGVLWQYEGNLHFKNQGSSSHRRSVKVLAVILVFNGLCVMTLLTLQESFH